MARSRRPRRPPGRIRPERLRGPPPRRRRAARRRDLGVRRRPPPRPDERRQPQPLGVHARRSGRRRLRRPRAARRRRRSARSTWTSTGASTPGSARSTSSRSCRSATRRWTRRSSSPGAFGERVAERFDLPVYLYARRPRRDRSGQARRRPPRPVRGPQGRDRPARARARPRAGPDAPVGRRDRRRRPAVPHRLQHQPRLATTSSSRSGSPGGSASPAAGCRRSRRTASSIEPSSSPGPGLDEPARLPRRRRCGGSGRRSAREAAEDGVELAESELIGLAPLAAFLDVADHVERAGRRPGRGAARGGRGVPQAARLRADAGARAPPRGRPSRRQG